LITPTIDPLFKARGIANYQFDEAVGEALFPDDCQCEFSQRSGQIRRISLQSVTLATIRPSDGRIALTIWGARRLHGAAPTPRFRVVVTREAAPLIAAGRSVFAKHVREVDFKLRAGDEVLVVDESDSLLAVGKANLCPQEMLDLTRGVAVRTRHSMKEHYSSTSSDRDG
jgi:predicted RNA-binding protein (TIGR00451 family)